MASKQRRKQPRPRQTPPATPPVEPASSGGRWALIAVAVAVVAAAGTGAFFLLGSDRAAAPPERTGEASTAPASSTATAAAAAPASTAPQFTSEDLEGLPMPPLPFVAQTAGPVDLMRQAYVFAARNPDVLDYVPCYCGCGQSDGHRGNTDCFVESRAPNGAVTEWDIHGMT